MDYSLLVGINDCKLSAEDGDDSDTESIEGLDKNGYVSSDDGLGILINQSKIFILYVLCKYFSYIIACTFM